MGAEVIKVERPGGEDARSFPPMIGGESLYVMTYNRNKLGATLDTRHPSALALLERLVTKSDVLVENYRPGTLAKIGLTPERLKELNPQLVVTSLSGFGQTGPMAGRALFDAIAQAMSGLMSRTGAEDDPPMLTGTFIADYLTGIYGALGTVTALYARQAIGRGQAVDVSSLDALFSCLGTAPSAYLELGIEPVRSGSRDPISGPANVFKTSDGWIFIHAGTNPLFKRLCQAMGREDLLEGPWATIDGRMRDIESLELTVEAWLGKFSTEEAGELLEHVGIPFGPVLSVPEAANLEQLQVREMIVSTPHTTAGSVSLPGLAVKLSATPGAVRHGAPTVGEHNDYVYGEILGIPADEVSGLRTDGII
jgi:CoA:oxalate CoA-transferase